ncbi:MAG: 30S ribosome-binding factor RbfA [Candidatus Dormibacteria bacterium]
MTLRDGRGQPSLPGLGGGGGRPPRTERVAEQLRQELSQLMVTEMKDPRVRLASVSEVRMSPDLRSARVMVSALGTEAERDAVIRGLRHAEGYLRSQLGGRLENLKSVPSLRFEIDRSIEYSVRINAMLRRVAPQGAAAEVEEEE